MAGIGGTPGGPVVAEDIRDLQGWTGHGRGALAQLQQLGTNFGKITRWAAVKVLKLFEWGLRNR
jgi:hypothetical protein